MSRSTVPKIRVPTVEELESTSAPTTNVSAFTKFRQGETVDDSGAKNNGHSEERVASASTKRKTEDQPTSAIENYLIDNNSTAQSSPADSASFVSGPRPGGSTVIVSSRQKGNPLLRFLRNVPYEFGQTPADYILGESCCALFLSLKFHKLHSDYVHERLKQVGHKYALQILLVQVDVQEPEQALRELNTICFNANWALMLAWSPEEAAELLESYKIYENKPPDFLMGRQETDPRARFVDLLTSIKSITRTDAENLIVTFGSLKNMVEANEEQLAMCPGLGLKKAKRLYYAFGSPWLVGSDLCIDDGSSTISTDVEATTSAATTSRLEMNADELFEVIHGDPR